MPEPLPHPVQVHIEWPDGAATQTIPAGTTLAHATTMVAALANAIAPDRNLTATWYVTLPPG